MTVAQRVWQESVNVFHAFFDHRSSRASMPKMRFMSPEQHFIQTLLMVYVALVGLTPYSSNMVHISMQVIILVVAAGVPCLNIFLRLRGLRVVMVNTFVMFFLTMVVATSPYYVPSLLVENDRCINATSVLENVGNSEIVTIVNCTNETVLERNETAVEYNQEHNTTAKQELYNKTILNCTTYLTTTHWVDVMQVGEKFLQEDFLRFERAKFQLGSPFTEGSIYPDGPIVKVTLILFVYIFILELPTRCTVPVSMLLFILVMSQFAHMTYSNILHAFVWLIMAVGRRLFLAILQTVREKRRREAEIRSSVKRSRIHTGGTPTSKYIHSGNFTLPRVNSSSGGGGGGGGGAISNPSFGSHPMLMYEPTLTSKRSPLSVPFLIIDECCVVTEVSQPFAEMATMDESFIQNRNLYSLLEWLNAEMLPDVMDVVEGFASGTKLEQALAMQPRRLLLRCCGVDGIDAEIVVKYSPRERASSNSNATSPPTFHNATSGSMVLASASIATQPPNAAGNTPQNQLANSSGPARDTPPAGRFAVILDCWRESEDQIVLQQPVAHSVLQAIPAPLCLLMADGTIVLWNHALQHITGLNAYDMIGQNAFTSLIGTPDQPMMKPRGFPFYAELTIGFEGKGLKAFSCTMIEWPNCDGGSSDPGSDHPVPNSGDCAIICYIDKSSKHARTGGISGKSGSSHLLSALGRLVNDFNDGKGSSNTTSANHVKRMTVFCEAVLSLVGQMAAIEAQENDSDDMIAYGSLDGAMSDGYASETPGNQKLAREGSGILVKTPGSVGPSPHPTFVPVSPQPLPPPVAATAATTPKGATAGGVWARLISADEATFPSCVIATTMGNDFKAGRSANCTYKMLNSYVSSLQFAISRKPGAREPVVILTDHSANGTYVNVKAVGKGSSVTLNHGDLINFRLSNGRFFMGFIFQLVTGKQDQREGVATTPSSSQLDSTPSPMSANNRKTSSNGAKQQKAIKWKIGEEMLGKGGNAEVYLGMNLTNGKLMAVKRVSLPRDTKTLKQYVALQDEINLLSVAVHPNIVQYYGSSQSDSHLNILLEFVPGGSLRHLLDNFGPLSDTIIIRYLRQVLGGLAYLHEMEIVHSDVKTANILVTDKGQCKLTDFGTAKLMGAKSSDKGDKDSAQAKTFTVVGTLLWMAPELVRGETKPTAASDVWSLGCAILEMMSGEGPWNEYDFESEEQIINLLKYTTEAPEIPPTSNAVIHAIAFECLKLNPKERPSCKHLLEVLNSHIGGSIGQQQQQRRASSIPPGGGEMHSDPLGRSASGALHAYGGGGGAVVTHIPNSSLAGAHVGSLHPGGSGGPRGGTKRSGTPHQHQQYHNQVQVPGGGKLVEEVAKARHSIAGGN